MNENNNTMTGIKQNTKHDSILSKRGILVILSTNLIGKTFIIDRSKIKVGRLSSCDLIIDDPLVSKEHCEITMVEEGKFSIEDLGSKNSTFLNGKMIKKTTHLTFGDKIIIGNTIMRFFLEEKLEG